MLIKRIQKCEKEANLRIKSELLIEEEKIKCGNHFICVVVHGHWRQTDLRRNTQCP